MNVIIILILTVTRDDFLVGLIGVEALSSGLDDFSGGTDCASSIG